jgi:hypothetical protein
VGPQVALGCLNFVSGLGAILTSELNEYMGSPKSMAWCLGLYLLGMANVALSDGIKSLLFGRIVTGLGVGIGIAVCPQYIAEISPTGKSEPPPETLAQPPSAGKRTHWRPPSRRAKQAFYELEEQPPHCGVAPSRPTLVLSHTDNSPLVAKDEQPRSALTLPPRALESVSSVSAPLTNAVSSSHLHLCWVAFAARRAPWGAGGVLRGVAERGLAPGLRLLARVLRDAAGIRVAHHDRRGAASGAAVLRGHLLPAAEPALVV